MTKVGMYIITHKKFDKPNIEGYKSLLVGAYKHDEKEKVLFDFCDDIGINISKKNNHYCELTGLYWLWKHCTDDIVGICHYRRYFTVSKFSNSYKMFLGSRRIEELLLKYDVIMPNARYYKESTYEALNIAPNVEDAKEIDRAISIVCPDYLDAYHKYLSNNKCYLYNMVVMKKSMLDQYCQWLFDILTFIENEYPVDDSDKYRSRLFGFLSERLIYVWLLNNIRPQKIKEIRVVKTDESEIWLVGQEIKNKIRNIYFRIFRRV